MALIGLLRKTATLWQALQRFMMLEWNLLCDSHCHDFFDSNILKIGILPWWYKLGYQSLSFMKLKCLTSCQECLWNAPHCVFVSNIYGTYSLFTAACIDLFSCVYKHDLEFCHAWFVMIVIPFWLMRFQVIICSNLVDNCVAQLCCLRHSISMSHPECHNANRTVYDKTLVGPCSICCRIDRLKEDGFLRPTRYTRSRMYTEWIYDFLCITDQRSTCDHAPTSGN